MVLRNLTVATKMIRHIGLMKNLREVQPAHFEVIRASLIHCLAQLDMLGRSDQLVEIAEAELGHQLAHLLRDEEHEIDDLRGVAREFCPQLRILYSHADRTGNQVT